MVDQVGGIADSVPSAIRGFFEVTRQARLRHQISATLDLYLIAVAQPGLAKASDDLGKVIETQSRLLREEVESRLGRTRDWSTFAGGMILLGLVTAVGYLLFLPFQREAWLRPVLVVVGVVWMIVLVLSLQALFPRKPPAMTIPNPRNSGPGTP